MKYAIAIWISSLFYSTAFTQDISSTIKAMQSTFNFEGDSLGAGTCFMVVEGSKQYFVTAAHLFKSSHKSGDVVPIKLLIQNELQPLNASLYLHSNRNVDVALFTLPEKVKQGQGISLDSTFIAFGSEVFFYGFPLTNMGTEVLGIKFPLVKRAIVSGAIKYGGADVLVLDGHNNRGFSGGPVVAFDTVSKQICIVSVISGYFFEPRNVQYKGERLSYNENSGIILSYGRNYILDILKTLK